MSFSKVEVLEKLTSGNYFSKGKPIDLNRALIDGHSYLLEEDGAFLFVENEKTRYRLIFYRIDIDDATSFFRLNLDYVVNKRSGKPTTSNRNRIGYF